MRANGCRQHARSPRRTAWRASRSAQPTINCSRKATLRRSTDPERSSRRNFQTACSTRSRRGRWPVRRRRRLPYRDMGRVWARSNACRPRPGRSTCRTPAPISRIFRFRCGGGWSPDICANHPLHSLREAVSLPAIHASERLSPPTSRGHEPSAAHLNRLWSSADRNRRWTCAHVCCSIRATRWLSSIRVTRRHGNCFSRTGRP